MNFSIMKSSGKELFSDALPIIEKFAPSLGGVIGGPAGFAIGYIIPILAHAFGAHPNDIKQIIANIISDPDAASKLQAIEHEHADWLCAAVDSAGRLIGAEINVKLSWADPK